MSDENHLAKANEYWLKAVGEKDARLVGAWLCASLHEVINAVGKLEVSGGTAHDS